MKYQTYADYKDSGVEWLGEVPEPWKLCRLKFMAKIKNGQDYKVVEVEEGYPVMGSGGQFAYASKFMYDQESVLLGRKGTIDKPLYINEPFWTVDTMYYTEINKDFYPRYLYYLALTIQFGRYSTNTALPSMTQEHLGNFAFAIPDNVYDRKAIAHFLDHETAKIDTLIEKQQQLVKLLKEKRQAVISHAVTKGLNPNVKMKDSGVEWLGEVPEHWLLPKVKWIFQTASGGTPNTAKFEEYYQDGQVPWIRTTDLNNGELFETPVLITTQALKDSACSILPINSVLVAMYGGAGSIGKHSLLKFKSTINQAVCAILPNEKIDSEFLHLFIEFYREFWMVGAEGTRKDPNISQDVIRDLVVPCPSINEQHSIVQTTKSKLSIIDKIVQKSESNIDLMQERRTALISAAVTGKIDVRNFKATGAKQCLHAG